MLRLLIVSALVHAMRGSSAASGTRATSAASRASSAATMPITDVHFEIFGKVQGVFFRKNTKDQADKLGLRGWCKNTSQGTVRGQVQGPSDKVQNMMHWLKSTGSPQSKIERAEFTDEKKINKYTFESFDIVRD